MDLLLSGGIVLLVIVLISIYAVYLFFTRLFKLSRERTDVTALMTGVNTAVRERNLEEAMRDVITHRGPDEEGIFIDRNVRIGVPASVGDRLRVQSAGGAIYLRFAVMGGETAAIRTTAGGLRAPDKLKLAVVRVR